MILRGNKVVLREKRLDDAYQDYMWRTDEELAKLDATQPLQTRFSSYRAFYADELQFPQPFKYKFAIDSLDGRHIGNCMYYDLDPNRSQAEVGIMIGDKEYWGQGYGADAVRILVRYLFNVEGLMTVYLHTLEWNHRAQRSFEKCGFMARDKVRRDGKTFVFMELSRARWERLPIPMNGHADAEPSAMTGEPYS